MSERALFFCPDDLSHKVLSLAEAAGTEEQEFQDYVLRELMSAGRIVHQMTVKAKGGGYATQVVEKEGPVCFMVTTTKGRLHEENETRMLSLEIDDSADQTRRVFRKLAELEGGGSGVEIDYQPWHDFQRDLGESEMRVTIPFAAEIANRVPPAAIRLRRDITQVTSIKAHALIHCARRQRDDAGRILAEVDDYAKVYSLMADLLAEAAEVDVSPAIMETVAAVKTVTAQIPPDQGATSQAVGKVLGLDQSASYRRLRKAIRRGLLVNVETRSHQPGKYRTTDQSSPSAGVLPAPDLIGA